MNAPSALARRPRLVLAGLWLGFWLLMVAVALLDYARNGGKNIWEPWLWETTSALIITPVLLWGIHRARRQDALLARPWRWFGRQIWPLPLVCIGFVFTVYPLREVLYALIGVHYEHEPIADVFWFESFKLSVFYLLFTGILFGARAYLLAQRQQQQLAEQQQALHAAREQLLQRQLQPHFLFNTLNLISATMHEDVDHADRLLQQFADLLRATLLMSARSEQTLADELDALRRYAELMQARFADRVQLQWQIDVDANTLNTQKLPTMLLQPLLENSFKHVVEKRRAPVIICVELQRDSETCRLRLYDNVGVLPADGQAQSGLGLFQARQRLQAMGGAITLSNLQPAGVCTEVTWPLLKRTPDALPDRR